MQLRKCEISDRRDSDLNTDWSSTLIDFNQVRTLRLIRDDVYMYTQN